MKTIFLIFVMVACASARVDPDIPSGTRWPRWQFPECRRPRSLMYDAVVGGQISQLGGGCHAPKPQCSVHHQGFCRLPLLLRATRIVRRGHRGKSVRRDSSGHEEREALV